MIKVGDTVKAFLDANLQGEVVNIVYLPSRDVWMVGGVPGVEAWADILLPSGIVKRVKTTELSVHNV